MDIELLKSTLKRGDVVVMPTDTIYGLVALASSQKAVEAIYKLKKRDLDKPPTIIIGNTKQLELLSINAEAYKQYLDRYWPGSNSLIMECPDGDLSYLHRNKYSLAIRLPKLAWLANLAHEVGPLATSSANIQDQKHAINIEQAKQCFGNKIKYYFDDGALKNGPSKLIDLRHSKPKIIRK